MSTRDGLLFVDLETCCREPVEFDLAHAPEGVGDHYPGVDYDLLHDCRVLVLAMNTTWRWDTDDQLPNGHHLAMEWLSQIRAALGQHPAAATTSSLPRPRRSFDWPPLTELAQAM